jgi:hypothetical protein
MTRRLGDALLLDTLDCGGPGVLISRALWRGAGGRRRAIAKELHGLAAWEPGHEVIDHLEHTARLRQTLGDDLCPTVFQAYGRDRRVHAWVEEDVGDLSLRVLAQEGRDLEATGLRRMPQLRMDLGLHVARVMATAWSRLESRAPRQELAIAPDDLRLGWDGRVRLLASRRPSPREADALVVASVPKGLGWLSPEAIQGAARSPRSEIYAIGVMLFETITGVYPLATTNALTLLRDILDKPLPGLAIVRSDVPAAVARLVDGCLARQLERRFGSWRELFAALEEAERSCGHVDPIELATFLAAAYPSERAAARRRDEELASLDLDAALAALDPGSLEPTDLVPLGPRAEDTRTVPLVRLAWSAGKARGTPVLAPDAWGRDFRPMARVSASLVSPGLLVDLRPVTSAEYARFVIASRRTPPPTWQGCCPPPAEEDAPVVWVSLDDATAYAAWAGKRIPDSDEWEHAIAQAGARLVLGEVWELTASERVGAGWVVRGGRWRDHPQVPPRPGNLSHSTAAADVGFRCVADA